MSKLQRLRKLFSYIPKKALLAFGIVTAVAVPLAVGAYGPERSTYTIEEPADHITFNSITNNPNIGDERNFVGARDASTGDNGINNIWNADEITIADDGKEYLVRMYVHNNAAANLNLVAENVTAKFNVPTNTDKAVTVSGTLTSSNASPTEYWDSVKFVSDKAFNLAYVAGSAKWENNGIGANGGVQLADSVVENAGVKLGYNSLDGKIPGCFEYAGYLTFKVKPQFASLAAVGITKSVAVHNTISDPTDKMEQTDWQQSIEAKPGDVVDYVIDYRNAGNTNQAGVTIRDMLPDNMTYVPNSTKYIIYRSNGELYREGNWSGDDTITENGINASEANSGFQPTSSAHSYVAMFSAKVNDDYVAECGTSSILKNVARVSVSVDGERFYNEDDADVVVRGDDCAAEFVCNALNVQEIGRTEFQFTTDYTVTNTEYLNVTYNITGDGVNETKVSNAINGGLYYNQIIPGTYTVKATVNTADGNSTSVGCTKTITVEEEEVPAEAVCRILTSDRTAIKVGESVNFRVYPEYSGDVTVNSTWMDFGDGEKAGPLSVVNYTHKYGVAGSFTAQAYVNFTVDGAAQNDITSANCQLPITVTADEEEMCDVPGKEHLPKDDPNCKEEVEMCDVPGFENLPKDDPRCRTPEDHCDVPGKEYLPKNDPNCVSDKIDHCKIPGKEYLPANDPNCVNGNEVTELPQTGAGEVVGIVGLGSMVTSAGYYISSRRRLGNM